MTNPVLQETIIRSMEDVPEQLVSDIVDDVQGKRLATLDADIRYQAAVTK